MTEPMKRRKRSRSRRVRGREARVLVEEASVVVGMAAILAAQECLCCCGRSMRKEEKREANTETQRTRRYAEMMGEASIFPVGQPFLAVRLTSSCYRCGCY